MGKAKSYKKSKNAQRKNQAKKRQTVHQQSLLLKVPPPESPSLLPKTFKHQGKKKGKKTVRKGKKYYMST